MALPFSAAHLAELRRMFLSSLTGAELLRLAAALDAAVREADAKAQAAQAVAGAAATPEDVQSALVPYASKDEISGMATKDYVDQSVTGLASEAFVGLAVAGLASEEYVDAKFDGTFTGSRVLDGQTLEIENGLIKSITPVP